MKKLMIAAAAAAMVGGAYATDCLDCNIRVTNKQVDAEVVERYECTPEVYNVKFALKTLAYKKLSGTCPGLYMEQGTRTLEGIFFTCCSDCTNWNSENADSAKQFEYTLWEKSGSRVFTDGLSHNNVITTYTTNYVYTYKAQHYVTVAETPQVLKAGEKKEQTSTQALEAGYAATNTLAAAYRDAVTVVNNKGMGATNWYEIVLNKAIYVDVVGTSKVGPDAAKAAAADAYGLKGALVDGTDVATVAVEKIGSTIAGANRYNDAKANFDLYVFSKKANKAEMFWKIDTTQDRQGLGVTSQHTYENFGCDGDDEADEVQLAAVGFGSIGTDKDLNDDEMYIVKSLSGNCAGRITPVAKAEDCHGQVATMCDLYDDEGIDWCWDYECSNLENTFAYGTWSLKYVKSIKGGSIYYAVPAFARDDDSLLK